MKLKWKNRYSGEEGFVKQVSKVQGHFTNTFVYEEAKKYNSLKLLQNDVKKLVEMGEAENNEFFAVE